MKKANELLRKKGMQIFSIILTLALVFNLSGVPVSGAEGQTDSAAVTQSMAGELVIIHTNDTHGGDVAVEGKSLGTAGVAQLKKDYEAKGAEVLLISAGDAIQGDPLVNLSKGKNAIKFMNFAGYDLMVPGNHEFDYGYKNLKKLNLFADFPFVSANIVDKATGEPVFNENYIFDTVIGKVGFFGLTTPETLTKANPDNVASLSFLAGKALYKEAQQQVDLLKKAGVKYIICVSHLGTDESSKPNRSIDVMRNVEGIDIIIDGHSHSVINGIEEVNPVLESAGTKLSYAGVITLDGKSIKADLISAADYKAVDPNVNVAVNTASAKIDAQLSKTFATTEVLLDGNKAPGVRTQETNLGDFAADAMLWAANQAVGGGVDAAVTNGGGIRASIAVGDITMKTMKTVFPFGNTVSTVKVTGAQLLELLEAATFSTPASLGAFPQVSGITFTVDTTVAYVNGDLYPNSTYYAPANPGARIKDVKVGGKALDLKKTYTIATNDFLAAGGDTYYALKGAEKYNTYVALEDALINYTDQVLGGVITADKYGVPAGRITVIAK